MFRILRRLVNFVAFVVELLLVFRLVLKFLVANEGTPFVAWIYSITAPLVAPFAKIIPNWKISGFVVDFTTLAALVVYALAAYLIVMVLPSPCRETKETDV